MGWINDTLNGKEKKIKADALAPMINESGKQGLSSLMSGGAKLNEVYNQDPTQVVNTQIGIENKLARGAADDATRRTHDLVAQRGIGGSSIGLGQEVNQQKTFMDKLALNRASGFSRLRDMQIENGQGLVNTGNALFAPKSSQGPIQMTDTKYRTGGYGQLIAQGAQAGATAYAGYKKKQAEEEE